MEGRTLLRQGRREALGEDAEGEDHEGLLPAEGSDEDVADGREEELPEGAWVRYGRPEGLPPLPAPRVEKVRVREEGLSSTEQASLDCLEQGVTLEWILTELAARKGRYRAAIERIADLALAPIMRRGWSAKTCAGWPSSFTG